MTMTEPMVQVGAAGGSQRCRGVLTTAVEDDSRDVERQQPSNKVSRRVGEEAKGLPSPVATDSVNPLSNEDVELKKQAKRNVNFPNDTLVTGYLEPANPWKNAPECTAEEIVRAYKKGCEINCVKPWNKIIQQLQAIVNCKERYKMLNLKGERLDQRHCETTEEIFRRIQFKTIDLEACHLDDETSAALFDMIEYYDSACILNISYNKNIGLRGWQACSRMIRKTPSLVHLDARGCELNDRVVPILGRSLKMGATLTTIHLENTYLSGRPLVILVAALKMNETLQELFLGDNKLMASDGIQLGNLLKYNHKLQLLDLRNNHLQDIGVGHLCDGLYEQNLEVGLNTLVLWNNLITYQAMSSLSRALSSTESLETVNLGHNTITNEGIHQLKDGLLKSKSLLRIGMQGTKVSCEGAIALAEYIADSPHLVHIDLRDNDIKTAGLMALSLALKVNKSLVRMELDRDTKKESSVKDYAEQQRRLQMDIASYLDQNKRLALQKQMEEEKHQLIQKADEEVQQQKRRDAEATSRSFQDLENAYIPTYKKIRRPTLLFPGHLTPQQTLDSPVVIPNNDYVNSLSLQYMSAVPSCSVNSLSASPPGELLLSPQYCQTTKAKKIFTVSKVGESSTTSQLSGFPVVPSSSQVFTNQSCYMDTPSTIMTSPSEISKKLADETVSGLIQMVISEAIHTHSNAGDISCGEPYATCLSDTLTTLTSNIDVEDLNKNKNLVHKPHCDDVIHVMEGDTMARTINSKSDIEDVSIRDCKENKQANKSEGCDKVGSTRSPKSSHNGETLKPEFHTVLSINGMTRELASVLDSLDLSNFPPDSIPVTQPAETFSSPDEFERELDEMLANVKTGNNLKS